MQNEWNLFISIIALSYFFFFYLDFQKKTLEIIK